MKKLLLLLVLLCGMLPAMAQLTTSTAITQLCPGVTIPAAVSYSDATTTYQPGNVFTVELSDWNGNFTSPLPIGTLTSTAASGTIAITIPTGPVILPGSQYRVRVVSSLPAITGTDNGTNLSIPWIAVNANSPLCEGGNLQFQVTNAGAGATFAWTGPNGFNSSVSNPSISNAQFSDSGTYHVFVTANGCTIEDSVIVSITPPPAAPVVFGYPVVCTGQTLALSVHPTGASSAAMHLWTGPNGFSSTADYVDIPNVTPADAGTYQVAAFQYGCFGAPSQVQVTVLPVPPITITPDTSTICLGQSITLSASGTGFAQYSWQPTGSNQQSVTVAPSVTTTYTLQGLSNNGCWATNTATINVIGWSLTAQSNSPVQTLGTIYLTAFTNQTGSPIVQWTGPNGFTATGTNVYIQNATAANAGVYTATLQGGSCGTITATANVQVGNINTVTGMVYHDTNNNGTFDIGEAPIPNVVLELQPGGIYGITNASGEFQIAVTDGSYTLTAVTQNAQQTVAPASYTVSVSGGGQVAAGNNFGFYSPPAADLSVNLVHSWVPPIPGFATVYFVHVFNPGTAAGSGVVRTVLPAGAILSGNTGGATISGDTLTWSIANLGPAAWLSFSVTYQMPASTVLGSVLPFTAWVVPSGPDLNPANNVASLYKIVVGSYDPNDKAVSPPGPISPAQVLAGQELTYTIRFQNTGTYLAFNVMVADTLSQHLDLSTLRMISASHNYNLSLRNPGILEWHFPNIMLPDSTTDEPNSHGYIQYSIKPKATLQLGDEIENTAHIFFDFNEAIVTNTTSTVVAQPNGLQQVCPTAAQLQLYPNPTTGKVMVQLRDPGHGAVQLRVYTLMGNLAHQSAGMAFNGVFVQPLNLSHLPAGMYIVQAVKNGRTHTERLFLQ